MNQTGERVMSHLAKLCTVSLIGLMAAITFNPYLPEFMQLTGTGTAWLADRFYWFAAAFILIEVIESAQRNPIEWVDWIADSALAFGALAFAFYSFLIHREHFTADQLTLMQQCALWGSVDFVLGLIVPQLIAVAARRRFESQAD